jgi:hypothetical protein
MILFPFFATPWVILGFLFWYLVASALPGTRSLAVMTVLCAAAFVFAWHARGDGFTDVDWNFLFLPPWIGAVSGLAIRVWTYTRGIEHRRWMITTFGAPIVAAAALLWAILSGPV